MRTGEACSRSEFLNVRRLAHAKERRAILARTQEINEGFGRVCRTVHTVIRRLSHKSEVSSSEKAIQTPVGITETPVKNFGSFPELPIQHRDLFVQRSTSSLMPTTPISTCITLSTVPNPPLCIVTPPVVSFSTSKWRISLTQRMLVLHLRGSRPPFFEIRKENIIKSAGRYAEFSVCSSSIATAFKGYTKYPEI